MTLEVYQSAQLPIAVCRLPFAVCRLYVVTYSLFVITEEETNKLKKGINFRPDFTLTVGLGTLN